VQLGEIEKYFDKIYDGTLRYLYLHAMVVGIKRWRIIPHWKNNSKNNCHLQSAITTCICSSATNNHMEINSENCRANKFLTTIPIRFNLLRIFLTVRLLFHMFAVLSIPSLLNFDNSQLRHEKRVKIKRRESILFSILWRCHPWKEKCVLCSLVIFLEIN